MSEVELRILKGTNDFLPDEQVIRSNIIKKLTNVFELYSFRPLETPILNYFDILASKYAGGAEILKETFKLTDQGERLLGLRYDLTIPLARVVGMNPHLKLPFKRYEVGKVFRDGPTKVGRAREFTQCDVDVIGVESQLAEAELIALAFDAFKKLNVEINLELNNRKLLAGILLESGYTESQLSNVILSIDKLKKIERAGVENELKEKGLSGPILSKAFAWIDIKGSPESILERLDKELTNGLAKSGIKELRELFANLKYLDIPMEKITLMLSLARGLEIYTGTVFEAFTSTGTITSSLAAGGRYDDIIGKFLGSERKYPAVGISFGLEPIFATIKDIAPIETQNRVLIISIRSDEKALNVVTRLRQENIIVDFDFRQKGITKSLEYANALKFAWVIIIGTKETGSGLFTLRDMITGKEEKLKIEEIITKLKKYSLRS